MLGVTVCDAILSLPISFGVEAIEPQRLKSFQRDSARFDAASEFLNDLEHVLTT